MDMRKAIAEATINGVVIGALVAGVMIFSDQVSNTIILRTTVSAMLMRFSFYMLENVDEVNVGKLGKAFGLPQASENSSKLFSSIKNVHFGKLI